MTKAWPWLLLALIALVAVANGFYSGQHKARQLLLNCSSELYDHDEQQQSKYFLLLDLQATGHDALINYRYFNTNGSPAGSVLLRGQITRGAAGVNYQIAVNDKQEQQGDGPTPEHMRFLSYITDVNLKKHAVHKMTLEVLDADDKQHFAVIRVQPGNGVYACRLQQ